VAGWLAADVRVTLDMADDTTAQLQLDCAELTEMLSKAKRPNVKQELQRVLDKLTTERGIQSKAQGASAASPAPMKLATTTDAKAGAPAPAVVDIKPVGPWVEITTFALDLGGYSSPTVTIDLRLKGLEVLPAGHVTCQFTTSSLDLKVIGLDGQNHRFLKTNLDKDIVVEDSSFRVKKNHVIITLQKVKGEYGYDSWADLVAKGRRKPQGGLKKEQNPTDGIMDMMKDLYDDGDDNMKKVIGEAMYKAKRGEKYEPQASDLTPPPEV